MPDVFNVKQNETKSEVFSMSNTTTKAMTSERIKSMTIDALLIALTLLATFFINIRLPIAANGGLVHLGNVPLFIAAIIFGKRSGALAGAIGMGLFDLLSGWTLWAPFTFVIVGAMGFVVGLIFEKKHDHFVLWYIVAMLAALALKIGGYYIAEAIIYGNWVAPLTSIPGNVVQVGTAAIISFPLVLAMRKLFPKKEA